MKTLIKLTCLVALGLYFSACGQPVKSQDIVCNETTLADDTTKDDILIIGDSISIGYTPTVVDSLTGYEVLHNPCNAQNSVHGKANISAWLAVRPHFKLVTFNHGLWDLSATDRITLYQYGENLRQIGLKILARADHVIFFTTTHAPGASSWPASNWPKDRELEYNAVAVQVMSELGIPVYDLHAVSLSLTAEHLSPTDIHYTEAGYEILGDAVTQAIQAEAGI